MFHEREERIEQREAQRKRAKRSVHVLIEGRTEPVWGDDDSLKAVRCDFLGPTYGSRNR